MWINTISAQNVYSTSIVDTGRAEASNLLQNIIQKLFNRESITKLVSTLPIKNESTLGYSSKTYMYGLFHDFNIGEFNEEEQISAPILRSDTVWPSVIDVSVVEPTSVGNMVFAESNNIATHIDTRILSSGDHTIFVSTALQKAILQHTADVVEYTLNGATPQDLEELLSLINKAYLGTRDITQYSHQVQMLQRMIANDPISNLATLATGRNYAESSNIEMIVRDNSYFDLLIGIKHGARPNEISAMMNLVDGLNKNINVYDVISNVFRVNVKDSINSKLKTQYVVV